MSQWITVLLAIIDSYNINMNKVYLFHIEAQNNNDDRKLFEDYYLPSINCKSVFSVQSLLKWVGHLMNKCIGQLQDTNLLLSDILILIDLLLTYRFSLLLRTVNKE